MCNEDPDKSAGLETFSAYQLEEFGCTAPSHPITGMSPPIPAVTLYVDLPILKNVSATSKVLQYFGTVEN